MIQAKQLTIDGIPYLAVPTKTVKGYTGLPLQYDLYARGDVYRVKRLGTTLADSEGNPTADITLFSN
jgi:hypothetical protein